MQYISDLHSKFAFVSDIAVFVLKRDVKLQLTNSKFALRPHHVWKYGRHPVCDR